MNDKQKLAQERTKLAQERTVLANQRTFSAWIRTGLSSVLAGLAIVKFIGNNQFFEGYVVFIGVLFVLIGIGIYILAFTSYKKTHEELNHNNKELVSSYKILATITGGMILTALLIVILLVFYSD